MENIKLNFLHVCDYASFSQEGKLNILGIFESINTRQVPYIHPQMYIVSNILIKMSGNFKKIIKIISEDSETEISRLEFPVTVKIPSDKKQAFVGIVGQFNNTKFEHYGKYKVQVYIDKELVGEKEITVSKSIK